MALHGVLTFQNVVFDISIYIANNQYGCRKVIGNNQYTSSTLILLPNTGNGRIDSSPYPGLTQVDRARNVVMMMEPTVRLCPVHESARTS